ncbi:cation-dependent mannose-6-phosphate receptor-like [Clavelina lepadiformis]|uniref:MRH domain-containing protein n=1 Tax=Clavelina lepadiformis TaxID=159417 RepID=A0ABP0H2Y4_CLALP
MILSDFHALILVYCMYNAVVKCMANCKLKNVDDEHSMKLLEKLEPLKGLTFQHTFVEKNHHSYNYTLNICTPVSLGNFEDEEKLTGVLQEDQKNVDTPFVKIGRINSTVVKGGENWLMLTYTHGDKYNSHCNKGCDDGSDTKARRQAHVMIVCDPNHLKGDFAVLYEHNIGNYETECFYMMELKSSVACTSVSKGLSSGSIFLIIFFSFAVAYLIIGAVYKRCVYGSKGLDQIPNIAFWKSCGSLQADGCNFLCRCQESGYNSNQPYTGIADDQLDEEIDDEHLLPM